MNIELNDLMKGVLLRILDHEIYFQKMQIRIEEDAEMPFDDTRLKIIDECQKLIQSIKKNEKTDIEKRYNMLTKWMKVHFSWSCFNPHGDYTNIQFTLYNRDVELCNLINEILKDCVTIKFIATDGDK